MASCERAATASTPGNSGEDDHRPVLTGTGDKKPLRQMHAFSFEDVPRSRGGGVGGKSTQLSVSRKGASGGPAGGWPRCARAGLRGERWDFRNKRRRSNEGENEKMHGRPAGGISSQPSVSRKDASGGPAGSWPRFAREVYNA
ncbi:hypothetical protein AAL_06477 [Moelleriella libera RCEF 2490]|uniref:Uncharacterized protein n=1 Tax=Moelleriella libera RCEF 2490 TaxID=1081109 RepID=A0A162ID47_9HYPO|nr:hypothetical protein AAL_06477 [Moelleriella libera RCEF 2490]